MGLEIIGMAVSGSDDGVGIEIVGLPRARPSPHLISSSFLERKRRQERPFPLPAAVAGPGLQAF